jgi:hypothetical protein
MDDKLKEITEAIRSLQKERDDYEAEARRHIKTIAELRAQIETLRELRKLEGEERS